eukprot:TRINITY_DN19264_c0_g3_i1.p1 TRINITY_DN19264_c0_g3~~TRINITY_DN19264_c0_g3_i1.p1  ORF type:complete len:135 (+),score=12.18 TRINITY_DN19264_c0_g3_i1:34-405(+)
MAVERRTGLNTMRRVSFGECITKIFTPFASEANTIPETADCSTWTTEANEDSHEDDVQSLIDVYSHFELLKIRATSLVPRTETPVDLTLSSKLWKSRMSRGDSQGDLRSACQDDRERRVLQIK